MRRRVSVSQQSSNGRTVKYGSHGRRKSRSAQPRWLSESSSLISLSSLLSHRISCSRNSILFLSAIKAQNEVAATTKIAMLSAWSILLSPSHAHKRFSKQVRVLPPDGLPTQLGAAKKAVKEVSRSSLARYPPFPLRIRVVRPPLNLSDPTSSLVVDAIKMINKPLPGERHYCSTQTHK
jgi:hypothetical protein